MGVLQLGDPSTYINKEYDRKKKPQKNNNIITEIGS